MWVDSEPCICDEPISGAPMEVSAKKLNEASCLVSKIRQIDHALERIAKQNLTCRTRVDYEIHGNYPDSVELRLPPDLASGLLRTMRFQALVKLRETGVTSMSSGYRPVVSA
jgi:hypothetical protein